MTASAACASQVEAWQARMERALAERLPSADDEPTRLHAAMRHCVLNGGERLRPLLLFGAARALGLEEAQVEGAACALELVHAYSLAHEELPALHEPAGAEAPPACHQAYDEGTAVLVGDALQSLAFQLLASDAALPPAPQVRLQLIALLARAIGLSGLTGGQSLHASTPGGTLSVPELEALYSRHCGALLRASVLMAAACAPQSSSAVRESLGAFATPLALALRLRRELSGTTADAPAPRARYTAALGAAGARERLGQLQTQAVAALGPLGPAAAPLRELAHWLLEVRGPRRLP